MSKFENYVNEKFDSLLVGTHGKIARVNADGTVDVQENETRLVDKVTHSKKRMIVTSAPVATFKFGNFEISTPVKIGDNVLVMFTDGENHTDIFQEQYGLGRHASHNAIVIHGVRSTSTPKANVEDYVIYNQGTPIFTIAKDGSEVIINAKLTCTRDIVGHGDLNLTGDSIANDHKSSGISGKSHAHTGVMTGGGNTGGPV